jgi:succinoglycan biosynthesis protein ExoA
VSATAIAPSSASAGDRVAVVMVVRDEPLARVRRAVDALAAQRGVDGFTVVIAAPARDVRRLRSVQPAGTVRAVWLVENDDGGRSAGLNAAARVADAEILVRVDARSVVRDDYVARCIARLAADGTVGVVGGVQRPEAYSGRVRDRGIARALRNRWLLGNADYRRPGAGGATDTVYLGAFRAADLLALGGYDERLDANEDFDVCARYRAEGRTVWLEPGVVVGYEPRDSLRGLASQYEAFGASKVVFWRATGGRPNARQTIAVAAGVAGALVAAGLLRRPRRLIGFAVMAAAGLAALDHVADPIEPDPRVRIEACGASAVIIVSWFAGVVSEALAGRLRRPSECCASRTEPREVA